MASSSDYVTNGENNISIRCNFCNSLILLANTATLHKSDFSLPLVSQRKDRNDVESETVSIHCFHKLCVLMY